MNPSPTRNLGLIVAFVLAASASAAWAQVGTLNSGNPDLDRQGVDAPIASHGGKAELLPGEPVTEADDPVNRLVNSETVDGLLLTITIDGANATLDSATLARVPKRLARADRDVQGDSVEVSGFVDGQEVSRTVVPDNVLNASEGEGLVRTTRRQIALALAADRPLDFVLVRAAATGVDVSLDVRSAYARICEADRGSPWCPRTAGARNTP